MITAALPNPSQPSFVLFAAAFGAFLGATVARARGTPRERLREIVENWTYAATTAALAIYVIEVVLQSA
jgi:hypothetical protein